MQLKFIAALASALLLSAGAHAQEARVVASCGTLPAAYAAGSTQYPTVDVNGKLCLQSASAPPSGNAGGDLGGTYPNPTVTNGSHLGTGTVPNAALVSPPTATGLAATGQIPGTTTNDSASAGNVGEIIVAPGTGSNNVTISIASPAVISDNGTCAAGATTGCVNIGSLVTFSNSDGALPTGISAATNYYIIAAGFTAGSSYEISTTPTGSAVNTSGSQSGTQSRTGISANLTNNTPLTVAAVSLTGGQWSCSSAIEMNLNSATSTVQEWWIGPNHSSSTGRILESLVFKDYTTTTLSENVIDTGAPVPIKVASGSSPTEYYLVVNGVFSAGSMTALGSLTCTRTR